MIHSSRPVVSSLLLAAALTASVGMSGCTGQDKDKDATPSPTAAASTREASPLPAEPTFEGTPGGAAADLKITDCPKAEGKQTAKATLTNSSKDKRDYSVMIIWLKNDNGTPLGSGLEVVKGLEPGQSKDIQITSDVVATADVCVPNVRVGTLKG